MQLQTNVIRTDGGTQPRLQLSAETINDYAESMADGVAFPPVVVFYDGADYWLADGFHRLHAAQQIGLADIAADVRQGTIQDAQWYSYSVNQSHGLRRSNEDKRRAVESALRHEYASRYSDSDIASHVGVHRNTILNYRREQPAQFVQDTRIVTRNGNTYEMNTANIGTRPMLPTIFENAPDVAADENEETDDQLTDYERSNAISYLERQAADLGMAIQPSNAPINFAPADSVEWYTPRRYIEAARAVMGGFDTDPASNETAQTIIQADTYYTIDDQGFDKHWRGRVWLNPPYGVENGKAVAGKWADRLIEQHQIGVTSEAILLVNAVIDSKWFNVLWQFPICFTDHRIRFEVPSNTPKETPNSPVIGSAFVYLGSNVTAFVREFSQFGAVVARLHAYDDQVFTEMEIAVNAE
jgi:hypothetical protein